MISLSIKVPGLDFIVGAAFQATFEGDSLFFSNQEIGETEFCDILFRGNYGVKGEFGWNSEDKFYCNDVDFGDALIEISTIEQSMCITLEPGSNKTFNKITDDVVLISVDNEIEIFLSRAESKIKEDITSQLGNEVLLLTPKGEKKLRRLINRRDSGLTHKKKDKAIIKKCQSTEVLNSEDIANLSTEINKQTESNANIKDKLADDSDTPQKTYDDVAWWTRSECSWDEDIIPASVGSDDVYNNEDYSEIDDSPEKDNQMSLDDTYDEEFDDNLPDENPESSISSEIRETKYEIEYEKNWSMFRTNKVLFKMHRTISRGLTFTVIPRFPGCNVVPDKYMFNFESESEVNFYVTPVRFGKCEDMAFEFWSSGSEIGYKKLGQSVNIKFPLQLKIIATVFLASIFIVLLIILMFIQIISSNTLIIALGLFVILNTIYFGFNTGNKIIVEASKVKEEKS